MYRWVFVILLIFVESTFACTYCASTSSVCTSYQQVCASYSNECVDYESVCTGYNNVCTSYDYSCNQYDEDGNCLSYSEYCASYTQQCSGYSDQCVAYQPFCSSYTDQCVAYQTVCDSYYYGDIVTVVGVVKAADTGLPVQGTKITVKDNILGGSSAATTDANGAYSISLFAYDDPQGNLSLSACGEANQLYPQSCKATAVRDSCTQPTRSLDFSVTPSYNATAFVAKLFNDVTKRSGQVLEVKGWVDTLQYQKPSDVANVLINSVEWRGGYINWMYQAFLGRDPDSYGGNYWQTSMANGVSDEAVFAGILSSYEYYYNHGSTLSGFVTGLYRDILGRTPDTAGLNYWVGALNSGTSRTAVAMGLLTSTEYRSNNVNSWYLRYLRRNADTYGTNYWVSALKNGMTPEQVKSQILGSNEYINYAAAHPGTLAGSAARSSIQSAVPSVQVAAPKLPVVKAKAARIVPPPKK